MESSRIFRISDGIAHARIGYILYARSDISDLSRANAFRRNKTEG